MKEIRIMALRPIAAVLAALLATTPSYARLPRVVVKTDQGSFTVEVETIRAPATAADFLRNVDDRRYDGGSFYRVVRPDNDPNVPPLSVVQGGTPNPDNTKFPPLRHESTRETGLSHTNGVLSVAREAIGTGRTAQFFICVGDNRSLDYGGSKAADGQGFAAFARVVRGMAVVRRILAMHTDPHWTGTIVKGRAGQMLAPPVAILSVRRER